MDIVIGDRTWSVDLDDRIGGGGFGNVYAATSDSESGVVKLVPKSAGAQRELLLADDLGGVPNIVPVYGVGDAGDSWAIAMKRADQSLREFVNSADGVLGQELVVPILLDVANALVSLAQNQVVHRDLKPENILLLGGHWCLTDFGISRYAEATTADDTRKFSLTPPYAAPEQWRGMRATSAVDVYAFGILAFELLAGFRPFGGPNFREQHIEEAPQQLSDTVSTPLRSIVDECLIKAPQGRPAPERLVARLTKQAAQEAGGIGAATLIEAHQREVARISERARLESAAAVEDDRRAELFDTSRLVLDRIRDRLGAYIQAHAPAVRLKWPLKFGRAELECTAAIQCVVGHHLPFDVIACAEIKVQQASTRGGRGYAGRAHSIWYCDAKTTGRYAWHETAFMAHPLMSTEDPGFAEHRKRVDPFSVDPFSDQAYQALSVGIGMYQVAWPFIPLLDDEVDEFIERWSAWFAQAADGQLVKPGTMPERPIVGSWR